MKLAFAFILLAAALVAVTLAVSAPAHANNCCVGGWVLVNGKWVWETCRWVVKC